MKLKNKRTREIIDVELKTIEYPNSIQGYPVYNSYNSLAELNENWQDYEEPEKYWGIDYSSCRIGGIEEFSYDNDNIDKFNKEIGNYFESKEEAEKAVEKLKALTEAKADGLKIKGYYYNHEDLVILADIGKCNKLTLDTLFGKEID